MSDYRGRPTVNQVETVEDVRGYPVCQHGIPDRKIMKEACIHFKIREGFNEVTGRVEAHYFPVTKDGRLTGWIKRDLTRAKKDSFSTIGQVGTDSDLLGQSMVPDSTRKLFIVEGVYDYLSLWQALRFSDYNMERGEGKALLPAVVSIGLGTRNAKDHIGNNLDFVKRYHKTVLIFDNDQATPKEAKEGVVKGQDAVQEVSLILPDMENVLLSRNDPNEYLVAGKSEDLNKAALWESKPYEPGSLVAGVKTGIDINRAIRKGVFVDCVPELMQRLQGLREAEFTVLLAPPKSGKSSLCKEINYSLLKMGQKTLGMYLEEDLTKTYQSFIAMDNNVHLPRYRKNPSLVSDEDKQRTLDTILSPEVAMFYDEANGRLSPDKVIKAISWAHIKGCKFVILDHLSYVFSGSAGSGNERKDIDNLVTEIADLVKKTRMHIIVVAHISRDKNKPKPKDSEGNIKYPYWYCVEEQDGRGSGCFEQVAYNLIGIDKEVMEDKTRGRGRVSLLLAREWDRTGLCDLLTVHPTTGRMISIQSDDNLE